jgi:ribosomal-protein-alanine N-acetyltransferase
MAPGHLAQVATIEADSFALPWRIEHFAVELCAGPCAVARVLLVDGQVAGYASAWLLLDELKINKLAVAGAFRRRGLGRLLVERLLDEARARGVRAVRLEVRESNRAAQALYLGGGFAVTSTVRGGYADGETALLMEAWLDAAPPGVAPSFGRG